MPPLSVWMVRAALLHLGIGFTFGALMLLDKAIQIDPDVWRLWSIHVELTLIGWVIQLAMGVAFWIMPRFARLPNRYGRRTSFAWAAFVLLNAGVLAVSAGTWWPSLDALTVAGRAAEFGAVGLFVAHLWPRIKPPGA